MEPDSGSEQQGAQQAFHQGWGQERENHHPQEMCPSKETDLSDCSPLKAQLVSRKRQEKIPKVGFQVFGFHVAKNIFCTGQGVYSILNKTS